MTTKDNIPKKKAASERSKGKTKVPKKDRKPPPEAAHKVPKKDRKSLPLLANATLIATLTLNTRVRMNRDGTRV